MGKYYHHVAAAAVIFGVAGMGAVAANQILATVFIICGIVCQVIATKMFFLNRKAKRDMVTK